MFFERSLDLIHDYFSVCSFSIRKQLMLFFRDEADFLGDRIAIMADGQLRCCGSSLFLKSRYCCEFIPLEQIYGYGAARTRHGMSNGFIHGTVYDMVTTIRGPCLVFFMAIRKLLYCLFPDFTIMGHHDIFQFFFWWICFRYGVGYHLTLVKEKEFNENMTINTVKRFVPSAEILSNVGAELEMVLNKDAAKSFESLFLELESECNLIIKLYHCFFFVMHIIK